MIADAVEAAVRAMKASTTEEIEAIITDERIDMILSKRENKKQKIDKL